MEELIKLLNQVPDTYEDFVAGVKCADRKSVV